MRSDDRLRPPTGTAVLRRYRTGSGEAACWLVAVGGDGGPRYCVLDDRTLLAATPPPEAAAVAGHLVAATGGRVDLLAATALGTAEGARAALDGLEIGELWLPWTEDPADPAARRLRRDHAAGATTLRRAAERLDEIDPGNAAPGGAPSAEHLRRVAAALPADPPDGTAERVPPGANGLDRAGLLAPLAERVRFRRAGEVSGDDLLPGLRLRVLAPADDEPRLAAARHEPADPPGLAIAEPAPRFSPGASLFAAALTDPAGLPLAPEDRAIQQLDRPFDLVYSIPYDEAVGDAEWGDFFRAHYGFAEHPGAGPAWRRIDADWLGTAAQLAFQLAAEAEAATLAVALEVGSTPALRFPPSPELPLPPLHPGPWTDHPLSLT